MSFSLIQLALKRFRDVSDDEAFPIDIRWLPFSLLIETTEQANLVDRMKTKQSRSTSIEQSKSERVYVITLPLNESIQWNKSMRKRRDEFIGQRCLLPLPTRREKENDSFRVITALSLSFISTTNRLTSGSLFLQMNLLVLFAIGVSTAFPMEILDVRFNDNATLTCDLTLRNISHPLPLWYKDEREVIGVNNLSNDPQKYILRQVNEHTFQLTLLHVRIESSGVYKCQNFISEEEKHFQVNLLVPPANLQLRANAEKMFADGRSTTFTCSAAQGYPIPIYRWYKNGRLIEQ